MRLVLFLVISLIFNAFSFGQIFNKTAADTCFLPLALGNKWQYIKEYGENGYNTALEEITITKDTIIDHKQYFYFKISDYNWLWTRYDKDSSSIYVYLTSTNKEYLYFDFRYPVAYTGNLAYTLNQFSVIGQNYTFLNNTAYCKGYNYGSWLNEGEKNYLYMNKVGIVFRDVFAEGPMGMFDSREYNLIGFISADSTLATTIIDTSKANIVLLDARGKHNNDLVIQFNIKHKYTRSSKSYASICYIQSAKFEYFYSNGEDTLRFPSNNLEQLSNERFYKIIPLNYELLNNKYNMYYKVTATDKAVVPNITVFPQSGYAKLKLTANENINNYPLKIGNRWAYYMYESDSVSGNLQYLRKIIVQVKKDTILSNGLKYYKVYYDSVYSYERIDTTLCRTYKAVFDSDKTIQDVLLDVLVGTENKNYYLSRFGEIDSFKCSNHEPIVMFTNYSIDTKQFTQLTNPKNNYLIGYNFGILNKSYISTEDKYYHLQLKAAYLGDIYYGDSTIITEVKIPESLINPNNLTLKQNYPNPFNPNTTIEFYLSKEGFVNLSIYDILGKKIKEVLNQSLIEGNYLINFSGENLSSGIYFYTLNYNNNKIVSKKMLLLK